MRKGLLIVLWALSLSVWAGGSDWPKQMGEAMVWAVEADYQDVRDDLKDAIESRGMVISYISHAKAMLERTGKDIGFKDSVYPGGAEIFLFCKSDISNKLVRANPHNIVLCPYAISVYDVAGEPGKVFLAYRIGPKNEPAFKPVEKLLRDIIEGIVENY
ncbi:Uncharacterized conserved protein, DUF302 family [Sulfurivirga caldicuralii]|uniref:Uncharacterized conserved protein, DUF302 family n=1 Tax=Sulfurivirga caldicuralii TaxID=364032 RepID=A0A1N6G231_9GAMM|nr:DUF302 domain-containing protein [Sulfurivirga caldicuralii]SIO01609.1 Uncharacterized conserved protein, DUF302 family [Sulfurivirga caldicuralii]